MGAIEEIEEIVYSFFDKETKVCTFQDIRGEVITIVRDSPGDYLHETQVAIHDSATIQKAVDKLVQEKFLLPVGNGYANREIYERNRIKSALVKTISEILSKYPQGVSEKRLVRETLKKIGLPSSVKLPRDLDDVLVNIPNRETFSYRGERCYRLGRFGVGGIRW